jgi:hypothetical protein
MLRNGIASAQPGSTARGQGLLWTVAEAELVVAFYAECNETSGRAIRAGSPGMQDRTPIRAR